MQRSIGPLNLTLPNHLLSMHPNCIPVAYSAKIGKRGSPLACLAGDVSMIGPGRPSFDNLVQLSDSSPLLARQSSSNKNLT